MSFYDALKALPADKHLKYEGPHGATALISVEVTTSGALYTIVRTQAHDSAGTPIVTTRGYAISGRADCQGLELALRDLGIGPDKYSIV